MKFFYLSFFGLVGIWSRYLLGLGVNKVLPSQFPYGIFIINILGAFLIGVIYVIGVERSIISENIRLALIVGLLGGFTTFSSYCLDAARLIEEHEYKTMLLYWGLSPIVGLFATFIGLSLGRSLLKGSL